MRAGPVATVLALLLLASVGPASARDPLFAAMDMLHDKEEPEAPEFALPAPEGQVVSLASFRGRVVLLNFWATWCPPCREEMPAMEQLHRALKDQGLTILAVDQDESPKLVAKFMVAAAMTSGQVSALVIVIGAAAGLFRLRRSSGVVEASREA